MRTGPAVKVNLAEVERLIDNKLQAHEIAAELGISRVTMWRYAKKLGRNFSDRKARCPRTQRILNAIEEGHLTAPDLARRLKTPRTTMSVECRRLEKAGLIRETMRWQNDVGPPLIVWRVAPKAKPSRAA